MSSKHAGALVLSEKYMDNVIKLSPKTLSKFRANVPGLDSEELLQDKDVQKKITNEVVEVIKEQFQEQRKHLSMDFKEYVNAQTFTPHIRAKEEIVNTEHEECLSFQQQVVVDELLKDSNVQKVYSSISGNTENFIIVLIDDDPDEIIDLTKIYWRLYDNLKINYPNYSIDFDYMTLEEFHESADLNSAKQVFSRR